MTLTSASVTYHRPIDHQSHNRPIISRYCTGTYTGAGNGASSGTSPGASASADNDADMMPVMVLVPS